MKTPGNDLRIFRKNENLSSYKLDYVGQHFIGDDVKDYDSVVGTTTLKSKNLFGLKNGHYIVFEIIISSLQSIILF